MKLERLTVAERFFNAAAIISLFASITLWFLGYELEAVFVGVWVPTILAWMNFFALKEQVIVNQQELLRRQESRPAHDTPRGS